jgi:hypothetical protein
MVNRPVCRTRLAIWPARDVGTPVFGGMILASFVGFFCHSAALCLLSGDPRTVAAGSATTS